ncbi:acetate--CoA ligase [Fictibacillus phosphorivorans]|uniref:acetate--CoA ligase n=1 Tax=Fictibacillus phosphorivorans TaxID=1221500 RepID=UPI00203D3A9E|nr:acetate--CoA ligase [Fictibacillus phosphorivorans]MCM3717330.1 acetate--CoA ligase [Fictibacillus phosphorivorans]MCM3775025.1 acetate--CoA ligase [Fictibacillus phosphorivorans]
MTRLAAIEPVDGTYNVVTDRSDAPFSWDSIKERFNRREDGKTNMAYECVDRHVEEGRGEKVALHYLDDSQEFKITYQELKDSTDQWAAVLSKHGVKKGDFVFVFLPKHPDCHIAMLAAIKLGAVVGPLFEAFMSDAVRDRIADCEGTFLITDQELYQRVPRKELPSLHTVFLTDGAGENGEISLKDELESIGNASTILEWVDPEHGLNIHYTSGSTGKPKGIIHAHRAMTQQYLTGRWVLDIQEEDVYWCTAHPGWVTGTVYGVFAPLLNGATIVLHGGRFKAEQWYETLQNAGVTVWYSAPTAFRMLMAKGNKLPEQYDLSKLRHILSVGEPLNPEVIYWGKNILGKRIHDTWWMTETGAQLIVNLPNERIKPGSMGKAFPGITATVLDEEGKELPPFSVGHLAIKAPWPAIMREVWQNKEKYTSYFGWDDWYVSGDLAYRDEDGYIFFQGRSDDMINSSGERIGPFEVESKLIEHEAVAEAGVIGKPDPIRGEIVKAFIVLKDGYSQSRDLLEEIRVYVRGELAAHAAPREIEVVEELPKTKISGKILRRELKARELQKLA